MSAHQTQGECPLSKRVDGPLHSWRFDGDDPYIVCVYCDELRDAITGVVIRAALTGGLSQATGDEVTR